MALALVDAASERREARMSTFYAANQRVYLRCDPSHYGRIRRGHYPYNEIGDKIGSDFFQFVRWEQNGASHVTHENVVGLMDEQEYYERRRLFIHAMRQPEMRWLREAFKHLKYDQGIDWRLIREIEISPPMDEVAGADCWLMRTDQFNTFLLWPKRYEGIEDFMTIPHHDESNPYCECYWCYDATLEKRKAERELIV